MGLEQQMEQEETARTRRKLEMNVTQMDRDMRKNQLDQRRHRIKAERAKHEAAAKLVEYHEKVLLEQEARFAADQTVLDAEKTNAKGSAALEDFWKNEIDYVQKYPKAAADMWAPWSA